MCTESFKGQNKPVLKSYITYLKQQIDNIPFTCLMEGHRGSSFGQSFKFGKQAVARKCDLYPLASSFKIVVIPFNSLFANGI